MRLSGVSVNPVLARELTERMRGPRAMIMLSAYLGVLGLLLVLVYRSEATIGNGLSGRSPVTELAGTGQSLFEWTLLFTMLLVLFLVPGFTAGSVAGERERQTLLPMQMTLLRPISIVLGKIGSSVVFTLLLVLATMPLLTVAYLIGGITLADVFKGLGMVLFTAVGLAAISVACSTLMKRVQTATVMSYGVVLFLAGATFAAFIVARQIDESRGFDTADPPHLIVAPNPIAALADLAGDEPNPFEQFGFGPFGYQSSTAAPLTGIRDLLTPDVFNQFGGVGLEPAAIEIDQFGRPVEPEGGFPGQGGFPLWGQNLLIIGGLAVVSVIVSSRRLRTPAKTER
jgi:ABC-2 type transport system permease protein